jgi:pyruvate/2-oxoglutarate dehydrogenase complex dihydrolipoamide dehydrogenase (E3) component
MSGSTTSCVPRRAHLGDGGLQRSGGLPRNTSYNDFEIVAANLLDDDAPGQRPVSSYASTSIQRGQAGLTAFRSAARPKGPGGQRRDAGGRAVEKARPGLHEGRRRRRDRAFLGAAILGVGGDEVVHAILDVMTAKLPTPRFAGTMHIHPTVSELVPTLLRSAAAT